jgi:hypothetical protein
MVQVIIFVSMFNFEHSCMALDFFKKTISVVKKTASKVGSAVKDTATDIGKGAEKVAKRVVKCAQAGALATQESAKEGAYRTANIALEGAKGAVTIAQRTLDGAKATLSAANATQKGLLAAAEQAQKGVLLASDAVQKAGMETVKGTLSVAAKLTDLTADAIAQGFNIKKVHFEASFADLASGALPKATVEGTVFGQSFSFKLDADFTDIESLVEKIINKVFG